MARIREPLNIKSEFENLSEAGVCERCGWTGIVYRALEHEIGTKETTRQHLLCWSCFDDWRNDATPWFLAGAPWMDRAQGIESREE